MVSQVIRALAAQLQEAYPQTAIYMENVKQGFRQPCFFIEAVQSSQRQFLGRRFRRAILLDIHYFPQCGERENGEALEVSERLYEILEYIMLDKETVLRGTKMKHEMQEGVLHFFIRFDINAYRLLEPDEWMQAMKYKNEEGLNWKKNR